MDVVPSIVCILLLLSNSFRPILHLMISNIIFQIIRYCFIFSWFYETTWYHLFHVFIIIPWWWLIRWIIIHFFLWILTPYCMCMVCVYIFFMNDIFDVVKEGSRSHLLVGIYTMHHFLPLPIVLYICVCTCVDFMQITCIGYRLP